MILWARSLCGFQTKSFGFFFNARNIDWLILCHYRELNSVMSLRLNACRWCFVNRANDLITSWREKKNILEITRIIIDIDILQWWIDLHMELSCQMRLTRLVILMFHKLRYCFDYCSCHVPLKNESCGRCCWLNVDQSMRLICFNDQPAACKCKQGAIFLHWPRKYTAIFLNTLVRHIHVRVKNLTFK